MLLQKRGIVAKSGPTLKKLIAKILNPQKWENSSLLFENVA
jgi:hypothetical protein